MRKPPVTCVEIRRVTSSGATGEKDLLATEEPLAIRLGFDTAHGREHRDLAITMRTPGDDLELVSGFLFTEGIIQRMDQIASIRHCTQPRTEWESGNLVRVELAPGIEPEWRRFQRHSYISSSCGVCGKTSIADVRARLPEPGESPALESRALKVDAEVLLELPNRVSGAQHVFGATGGLHAAALFSAEGALLASREDVGRHNALDKLLGLALAKHWIPLQTHLLFLSGRASFELIQKAALAGVRIVCAVGAPSSLAVESAGEFGVTLVGFLREQRFNLYTHPERVRAMPNTAFSSALALPTAPS